MSEKLKCEVVRDLLPSYVDGLTSEVTNEEIRKHLKDCPECEALLGEMQEPEALDTSSMVEFDYLKKVKRHAGRRMLFGILTAIVLVTAVFLWRIFVAGFQTSPSSLNYTVSLDGKTVTVSGTLLGSGEAYSRIKFKEADGIVTAAVYTVPVSLFGHTEVFDETYTAKEAVRAVYLGDLPAYENGAISRNTALVYQTKTSYVGDFSADNKVAEALGIRSKIGNYTNQLQTSAEPYDWKLSFIDAVSSSEEKAVDEEMTSYAYVMLALVGNLGSVSWEYTVDGASKTQTVTQEEASAYWGDNIKNCSLSVSELQKLMHQLNLD